jgi:hypothetical protein
MPTVFTCTECDVAAVGASCAVRLSRAARVFTHCLPTPHCICSAAGTGEAAAGGGEGATAGTGDGADAAKKGGAFLGVGQSTYDGRHSEGNRFIVDRDL